MARKIYSTILAKPTQSILKLIITITISSSVIGALVSLFSLIILDCDWFKNSSLH